MAYKKVGWKDYPDTTTPVNATNLNQMDEGLAAVDQELTTQKENATDMQDTIDQLNTGLSELNLKLNQKGKRIAPLKVSQTNMTVHDTVIYELPLLNIVFMSVTFSINSGGNIQLFIIEDKYRPVEKSKLLISNHAIGATVYTDGKIAYDSDGHGLTLGIGTYTMIGMYRYFV